MKRRDLLKSVASLIPAGFVFSQADRGFGSEKFFKDGILPLDVGKAVKSVRLFETPWISWVSLALDVEEHARSNVSKFHELWRVRFDKEVDENAKEGTLEPYEGRLGGVDDTDSSQALAGVCLHTLVAEKDGSYILFVEVNLPELLATRPKDIQNYVWSGAFRVRQVKGGNFIPIR